MAFRLHIEGEANKIGFYKLNDLELEGFDPDQEMALDAESIRELMETANDYVESGELDLLEDAAVVTTLDPDATTITLDADSQEEVELSVDDITLAPENVDKKLTMLEKARIGDIIFVRTEVGDAYWDYSHDGEESFDSQKVAVGYLDCTRSHDEYEVLRESYYDFLCDRLVPGELTFQGEKLEVDEHVMRTNQVWGELYVVRENLPDHRKVYEKVDLGGPLRLDLDESSILNI